MMTMKQCRVGKNLTQEETAEKLGISTTQYRKYEKMQVVPSIKFGYAFADLFDTNIEDVIFFRNQDALSATSK